MSGDVQLDDPDRYRTSLKAMGQKIQWSRVFPTEAFEWKRGRAIRVS